MSAACRRGHAFAEIQQPVRTRGLVTAGVRADSYTTFGSSLSPSVSGVLQVNNRWRLRASAARAFRVPTFTELYYHDPANLGTPGLKAEHGWSTDAGVERSASGWTAIVSPFVRWDEDVIDWVRGHFSALDVDAPSLGLLSKYVLEFARYSAGGSLSSSLGHGFRGSATVDYRSRADGQRYALVGVKVSRAVRLAEVFVDGTNLLNETYREIAGVSMPGRWLTVGVTLRSN